MAEQLSGSTLRPASAGRSMAAGDVSVYLDPPTHHQFNNKLFERESNPFAGDDILAPYIALQERFARHGITTRTADQLPAQPDGRRNVVISFGTPDRLVPMSVRRYRALAARPDVVLSAFFAMECPIVEPRMFQALPALSRLFRRIYSWSDTEALLQFTRRPVPVEHFCWPQSFDAVHEQLWGQRDRKFLLMMNANKLPRLYVDELYTARLRAVQYFEQFSEVDLYGRGWDGMPMRVGKTVTPFAIRRLEPRWWALKQRFHADPVYAAMKRAWRGPARSKSATVAQYRFSLCFENSILKGWMTEKLFDCFFTGTVPVYWGAPDVLDWVPAECFIDMRQFKDFGELRAFLKSVTPAQEQAYRDAARAFIESDRFTPWTVRTFADTVARAVSSDTGRAL